MLFHSFEFMIFFAVTLCLYYAFPGKRIYLLALANLFFYSIAGIGYLALFIGITSITYFCSLKLQGKFKKLYFLFALILNISNLVFFKYSLFIFTNIERFVPFNLTSAEGVLSQIILPIGISFYTFQIIAYIVDVYQGKLEPCRNWLDFWVFTSLFAKLVAGPIMRGKDLLPQIETIKEITFKKEYFKLGIAYFMLGLIKKIILADQIAPYVEQFYAKGAAMTGADSWLATYLFGFQLYFDFSAYSDMAVGVGYLLGLKLAINFKTPYLSGSGTEFWRRWHITLSNWIRDYVYIPLGGSRKGKNRQLANILLAMFISGLWHGASWSFILWGVYHGVLQVLHKIYLDLRKKFNLDWLAEKRIYHFVSIFVFFNLASLGWVLFGRTDIKSALVIISKMLYFNPLSLVQNGLLPYVIVVLVLYGLHIIEYFIFKHLAQISLMWHKYFPAPIRGLAYTLLIVVLVMSLGTAENNFIYFQF
ncbi:D-alanyl-lipoteichoic acid acyltransferase DltB, MBOAT superfamily [Desulfonispora thiosulfatigenes DSM 11270]|uniref:D-alanyl-lipoteichoic acid acyltransferase DltB, MBOAT superfamily n=1 Tax=Desulfonispora thiosulfatigenes DSM 11270 TaxID=656914 RepID=A0A1W1V409_DESTI|nr:MBOAT family O-acyltransferase [Desulfonispora thiosulfatigenes]SMB88062.1 D-alanyl-lipoteichoic acid acyltransferase DltB, MBOAT superfamily [Desulfonispora thiosulfatigenes DSM 11270]